MDSSLDIKNNLPLQLDVIQHTINFWEQRSETPVSEEAARAMVESVVGFFSLLLKWDAALAVEESRLAQQGETTPDELMKSESAD